MVLRLKLGVNCGREEEGEKGKQSGEGKEGEGEKTGWRRSKGAELSGEGGGVGKAGRRDGGGRRKKTGWSRSEGAELNGEEVYEEKRRGKGGGWLEDNKLLSKSTSLGMDMMSG